MIEPNPDQWRVDALRYECAKLAKERTALMARADAAERERDEAADARDMARRGWSESECECEALRADLQAALDDLNRKIGLLQESRAELERLRAEHSDLVVHYGENTEEMFIAQSGLAAATDLLRRITTYAHEDGPVFTPGYTRLSRALSDSSAFLAGQPAVPTCECSPADLWECPVPGCPARKPGTPVDAMNVDTPRERPKASLRAPYVQPLVPESQPAAPTAVERGKMIERMFEDEPAAPARTEADGLALLRNKQHWDVCDPSSDLPSERAEAAAYANGLAEARSECDCETADDHERGLCRPAAPDIKTESYCGFEYPTVELSHAQPAAPPTTIEVHKGDLYPHPAYVAASARGTLRDELTRDRLLCSFAERAVLDACHLIPEHELKNLSESRVKWRRELATAQLARRVLKP